MNRLRLPPLRSRLPLLLGLLGLVLSLLPMVLLGADGYVICHDQLDGEVMTYLLHARHFFADTFEEFLGGMSATALTPPSYGSLLFYLLLPPYGAFLCNYIFVALAAFLGMYLLLDELLEQKWLAALVALMFAQLPFYSVYGLSVMGQPLLLYACLQVWKKGLSWRAMMLTGVFGLFSSLVLVGYADLFLLCCFGAVLLLRRHPHAKAAWLQVGILLVCYLLPNLSLLGQILFPTQTVSHKTELVAGAADALSSFQTMFREGQYHAASLHTDLVGWALGGVLAGFAFYSVWSRREKRWLQLLGVLTGAAAAIAAFYALWHWEPVVQLRNRLGGLFISFQADRFYWLYPVIWFVILGLLLKLLLQLATRSRVQKAAAWLCICVIVSSMGITLHSSSVFRRDLQLLDGTAPADTVTWDDFYSPELFDQIQADIGLPQEDYRVASVALYPSVPLYNGFYCIDGYSNNYDVEYKHKFRSIISRELEKSDSLQSYFDNWGNRCYLFSAELGKQYYFTKDSDRVLNDLSLSAEGLKELGCDYIFSGLQIGDPGASGLEFVKTYEHQDSSYRIWLYRVI